MHYFVTLYTVPQKPSSNTLAQLQGAAQEVLHAKESRNSALPIQRFREHVLLVICRNYTPFWDLSICMVNSYLNYLPSYNH